MKIFKEEGFRISLLYFLITRIALIFISYFVIHEFAVHGLVKRSDYTFHDNDLLNIWGNFDTGWYLKISREWYPNLDKSLSFSAPVTYSFFPLYPGLVYSLNFITGLNHFIIGLIISNICLLLSGWLLYKLSEKIYNKEIAKWSVIFMYVFPGSFILSGVFTESLYLFLVLCCFYFIINKKWFAAGATSFFLTLSRPIGVFVLIPFAYEYFKNIGFDFKKISWSLISIIAIPAAIFILELNIVLCSGKEFSFSNFFGSGYKLSMKNPLANLYTWVSDPYFTQSFLGYYALITIIFWMLFYKHINISMHIVMLYSIFIPMCYTLMSSPRMMLAAFPLFIQISSVAVKYRVQNILLVLLTLFQGYLFICWCLGFGNVI